MHLFGSTEGLTDLVGLDALVRFADGFFLVVFLDDLVAGLTAWFPKVVVAVVVLVGSVGRPAADSCAFCT